MPKSKGGLLPCLRAPGFHFVPEPRYLRTIAGLWAHVMPVVSVLRYLHRAPPSAVLAACALPPAAAVVGLPPPCTATCQQLCAVDAFRRIGFMSAGAPFEHIASAPGCSQEQTLNAIGAFLHKPLGRWPIPSATYIRLSVFDTTFSYLIHQMNV